MAAARSLADCAATAPTRGYESKDIHLLLTRLRHEDLEPSKLTSRDIPIRVFAFQTVQFLKEQLVRAGAQGGLRSPGNT